MDVLIINAVPVLLSETNNIVIHGEPGVSNAAGAALWTIDHALQAATLGISEVYFHQGVGFMYNFVCLLLPHSIFSVRIYS